MQQLRESRDGNRGGWREVKMVVYQCQDAECGAIFALEIAAVKAIEERVNISCSCCGMDDPTELGDTDVFWEAKAQ